MFRLTILILFYFGILFLAGISLGYSMMMDKNQLLPKEERAIFIENCMKTGQTEALCIDNFHGFPRREERF